MRHLSGERLFNELHRLHPTGWSSWECLNADEQREVAQALSVVMEDREQVSWQRVKEENQRAIDAEERARQLNVECDRLLEKVAILTVENADLKEQRAVFGEDLDRAFLDGYGAAYIKARPGRFVPMTEYADEAADALTEWHKDNGDTVDNACVGCGVSIDEGRTHCGSLECGSGSIER